MSETVNLQEAILKECRRDKVPVTLFLMNGFQLRGVITGFDSFVVVLVTDGKQQMIYKHAISTLAPIRPLKAAERCSYAPRATEVPSPFAYFAPPPPHPDPPDLHRTYPSPPGSLPLVGDGALDVPSRIPSSP